MLLIPDPDFCSGENIDILRSENVDALLFRLIITNVGMPYICLRPSIGIMNLDVKCLKLFVSGGLVFVGEPCMHSGDRTGLLKEFVEIPVVIA